MSLRARALSLISAPLLLAVAALAALVRQTQVMCGEFAFPLDDAYIHLGLARRLVEHGNWGLNPGEFVSASSSPAWTALLALSTLAIGSHALTALWLNGLAAAAVLWTAARWLMDEALPDGVIRGGLIAMVLLVPLPFVAGLGMEHTAQIAAALALIRLSERAGGRRALLLAPLAGLACLLRYESAFLVGWLGLGLLFERRWGPALAALGGGAAAILGFGVWSQSQGGLFLPNSLLLKSAYTGDWLSSALANLNGSPQVLGLALAAGLGTALDTGPLHRRRAALFIPVALTHLLLARVGWLFRYEAWLIAWGCLLLVSPALLLWRGRGRASAILAGVALALPLVARAGEALARFAVGARSTFDTNIVTARWLASLPAGTVAVQDLGAISFYTDWRIVDLVGLGDDEIARLRLDARMTGPAVDALLRRKQVTLAIAGRDWMSADRPLAFLGELASVSVPYPAPPGHFETVIWIVDPARRAELQTSLVAARDDWNARVKVQISGEQAIPLTEAYIRGEAVQTEGVGPAYDQRLAFYTNGHATFLSHKAGQLAIVAWGSPADGRGPEATVVIGEREVALRLTEVPTRYELGPVEIGDKIRIDYYDDVMDKNGDDRNLFIDALLLRAP